MTTAACTDIVVRHLRQILLWPLRLVFDGDPAAPRRAAWQTLRELDGNSPWREVADEYGGAAFEERHYNEFVSFLPYVQRFLYGQGRHNASGGTAASGSPMRVFRRSDVVAARVVPRPGDEPLLMRVEHVDLYFFHGVDLVLLNMEVAVDDLPLALAQELLYRFGRAYPAGWDAQGQALHCLASVEWLDAAGTVLARSDAQQHAAFLAHVAEHRAPRIAAHWAWLLQPLVAHHSVASGALRWRQIEYYRMPTMAYLAVDDPRQLSPGDFLRLGRGTGGAEAVPGSEAALPQDTDAVQAQSHFEQHYCYDRFWVDSGAAPNTRYLCSGLALIVVGDARSAFYSCGSRGVLAQFRHQHFLLFLIAHFQKAALLMFSDQLAEALTAMDVSKPSSVKRFKRQIRASYVAFLGFTHRYWFHEVSEQAHVKALFAMCTRHLQIDSVYDEVKERIRDMSAYLDADALRRQANTVVRLTVVTILGLIGTITTGFLGMNLLAEADAPLSRKLAMFVVVLVLTAVLTMYTMVKSKRLSDFLDVVSDERLSTWSKTKAFFGVWKQ